MSLAEGESRDALCAEVELMQGGTRVDDRRVTVSAGAGASQGTLRLHVRSSVPVDEPVVQLTVRAGCQMNASRQYVLLADMPSDVGVVGGADAAIPRSLPAVSARNEPSGGARGGVSSSSSAADADDGTVAPPVSAPRERVRPPAPRPAAARNRNADAGEARRPVQRAAAPRRAVASAKPPVVAPAAAVAAPTIAAVQVPRSTASGARLQLEGLDPASVRNPAAAASAPMAGASAPAPLPVQGASASAPTPSDAAVAAAVPPEELQRANERLQSLEATLKVLREQSAQNQRMLMEMRSELAEARDSRYANPLVYVLVLLLLLALIALALLYRLVRNGGDRPAWWGDAPLRDDGGPHSIAPDVIEPPVASVVHDGMDADVRPAVLSSSSAVSAFAAEPVVHNTHYDDTVPQPLDEADAPTRHVNTEELFDVQQQSDFFVSLGQHDQAIAVLSEHIADNPETSALAYLDLLRIYHSLERREDYARVASEFERAFNAEVPVFEHFAEVGNGLEHYRNALARIEAQWPGPGTLGLIEELVFRKPGARGGDESFDLAAYRELLLLYSVAKEVIDPHSAPPTPVTPLSFLDTHEAGLESRMLAVDLQARYESQETQPDALRDDAVTVPGAALPSIYGTLDEGMAHDTEPAAIERAQREAVNGIIDFDTTLLATTTPAALAPMDASQRPTPAPSDWLSFDIETPATPAPLDLQLFDPATEAEIAPKPKRRT
ncbi:type IV pilus assembly protein FimV [Variovorax sp. LT1R16]|uniref:type IV pilus assembly protein FimV n=1 Tax=Variovorax sp. LT1R16 TaxID=3443728 RepID=UPI003F468097